MATIVPTTAPWLLKKELPLETCVVTTFGWVEDPVEGVGSSAETLPPAPTWEDWFVCAGGIGLEEPCEVVPVNVEGLLLGPAEGLEINVDEESETTGVVLGIKEEGVGLLGVVGDGVTVGEGAALKEEGGKSVEDELAIVSVGTGNDSGDGTLRDIRG